MFDGGARTRTSPSGSVLSSYSNQDNLVQHVVQVIGSEHVVKQGVLRKKSPKGVKGIKIWQIRFFVLYGNMIKYFASEDAFKANIPPKGSIQLACIEALALASDNRIHIGVNNQKKGSDFRTFYLKAESIEEAQSWFNAIQRVQEAMLASRGTVAKSPQLLNVALGFHIPGCATITLDCVGCMTGKQVKQRVTKLMADWGLSEESGLDKDAEQRLCSPWRTTPALMTRCGTRTTAFATWNAGSTSGAARRTVGCPSCDGTSRST